MEIILNVVQIVLSAATLVLLLMMYRDRRDKK